MSTAPRTAACPSLFWRAGPFVEKTSILLIVVTPLSHRLTGTALSSRMPVRRSSHSAYEDSHALATVYCSYSSCIHCDLIHYYENFSSAASPAERDRSK